MLCCDGRTSHHVTWFKRLCRQTVQSDHKRVVPRAGLRTTQYLSCTECTGSSRDVKFCRRRPHCWSCTLLGLCTLGSRDTREHNHLKKEGVKEEKISPPKGWSLLNRYVYLYLVRLIAIVAYLSPLRTGVFLPLCEISNRHSKEA